MAPIERTADCPSCGRSVRLTEEELMDKRGFCAVCDAKFDIRADMLDRGQPFREAESLSLAPRSPLAPTTRIEDRSTAARMHLVMKPVRAHGGFGAFGAVFAVFWFGFVGYWIVRAPGFMKLFGVMIMAFGVFFFRLWFNSLLTVEELLFDGQRLKQRRSLFGRYFTRERSLSTGEIESIQSGVETVRGTDRRTMSRPYLSVVAGGRDPMRIGQGLGYGPEVMAWLEQRLREKLRR